MRTVAHELRRTLRFEADTRERAAPLVIVLDILVLPFFICEGRRGSLCSRIVLEILALFIFDCVVRRGKLSSARAVFGECKQASRRTTHCQK